MARRQVEGKTEISEADIQALMAQGNMPRTDAIKHLVRQADKSTGMETKKMSPVDAARKLNLK